MQLHTAGPFDGFEGSPLDLHFPVIIEFSSMADARSPGTTQRLPRVQGRLTCGCVLNPLFPDARQQAH